jgi:hypothetical protein
MKMIDHSEVKDKIVSVLNSCETIDQFEVAERMIDSYNKKYGDEYGIIEIEYISDNLDIRSESIINWELHQKLINDKKKFEICLGIGMNQFFPEYITIDLTPEIDTIIDISWLDEYNK